MKISAADPTVQGAPVAAQNEELRRVCREFESILLSFMFKQMRNAVPKSDLLPSSSGQEMYQGMLDDQYAALSAESGSFGLGELLYRQLTQGGEG